jgi:hypothetical protein
MSIYKFKLVHEFCLIQVESRVINFSQTKKKVINFLHSALAVLHIKLIEMMSVKTNNKTAIKPKILTSIVFLTFIKKLMLAFFKVSTSNK